MNSAVLFLEETVKKYGNKTALIDKNDALSFNDLRSKAMSIGSFLLEDINDNKIDYPIVVFLPKSYKSIISFIGALYSANPYIPLDYKMPVQRLKKIFDNLNPYKYITDLEGKKTLLSLDISEEKILIFDEIVNNSINEEKISQRLDLIIDTDPIYLKYTSGSTGFPKGVVASHRGVIDYADWVTKTFDVSENTIMGNQSPFHFDNSILDIYSSLKTGATIVIIPEVLFEFPDKLPEYIEQQNINFIFWVPTVIINVANSKVLKPGMMNKLEKILFCGEVMPTAPLNEWIKNVPQAMYANLYGPTEITDVCTYYVIDRKFANNESLPIGKPCKNTKTIILTSENKEATVNEMGELCILGSGVTLGYWNNKKSTDEVFCQNPLNDKYIETMYRTGDLVYKNDDNLIIYVGRKDSQIKHRGNRIELMEIETAANSLEDIDTCCILYDNEKQEIVLFYVSHTHIKPREIRKELKKLLQSYMLPTKFVELDKMVYNANSKIDRVLLKEKIKNDELNYIQ